MLTLTDCYAHPVHGFFQWLFHMRFNWERGFLGLEKPPEASTRYIFNFIFSCNRVLFLKDTKIYSLPIISICERTASLFHERPFHQTTKCEQNVYKFAIYYFSKWKKLWLTLILTVKFLNKNLSITKNTWKIGFEFEFDLSLAEVLHPCNKSTLKLTEWRSK